MKILYAIQGTGNGHLSRARAILPILEKFCQVDVLVSGYQKDVKIPYPIKYNPHGLSFIFGKKGGVDMWNTYIQANIKKLQSEINVLPVEEYDFILNDFEPVSAWACYKKKIPCISLSHQAAVLNKNAPKPKKQDLFGRFILKNYAPSNIQFGLHFSSYDTNIYTPVIRSSIRNAKVTNQGHYTVYLPSYSDKKLINSLSQIKGVQWKVFSKHSSTALNFENVDVIPIHNERYIESLRTSAGLLCGAGFEAPAEALHLGKKLMVAPMKSQYEQQCNAAALKYLGIPVMKKLKDSKLDKLKNWIESDSKIEIEYPDITKHIIQQIFESHVLDLINKNNWSTEYSLTFKEKDEV